MRPRLILMQGKPATGKTTVAEAIEHFARDTDACEGWPIDTGPIIVSADAYLWDGPEYVATVERIVAAHQQCEAATELLMEDRAPLIIVDNTNIKFNWAKKHIQLAYRHGYDIQVVRVEASWNLQVNQNDIRSEDRKVPLEHYRWAAMEDLLCESCVQSFSERWRLVWSLFSRLFLSKHVRTRTKSYTDTILWKK